MMGSASSVAKARYTLKGLFAALKRCATQKMVIPGFGGGALLFRTFARAECGARSNTNRSQPKADVIFIHANVYTGVPSNAQFSSILREEAIAVRGDRIQAVGKNVDIEKLKGPQTQVVDLGGHFVMPGFNDAHLHLAEAGLQKLSVDLTGVKTLEEFRRARASQGGKSSSPASGFWAEAGMRPCGR